MAEGPKRKKKIGRILNIGFGVLNPLGESLSGKNFTPHNVSSLDAVRKSTVDHFSEHLLQKAGHFIGVVLRVDGSLKEGAIDPSHWANTSGLMVRGDGTDRSNLPDLLQIRVRIPELHSHLPVPEWLPAPTEGGPGGSTDANRQHDIINMYPSFVGASELLTQRGAPTPGDFVWVDFQNRSNYSGPTYYDKVQDVTTFVDEEEPLGSEEDASLAERLSAGEYVPEYIDGTTTVELSPGYPIIKKTYRDKKGKVKESTTFDQSNLRENRVRYFAYGNLNTTPGASSNVVTLAENMTATGFSPQKVHSLVAVRLEELNALWLNYYEFHGLDKKTIPPGCAGAGKKYENVLKVSSGYRKPDYSLEIGDCAAGVANPNCCPGLKKYCQKARARGVTCKARMNDKAFMSSHSTGLCVDFRGNGLNSSKSKGPQRKSEAFKFLTTYGWLCGFYPYAKSRETWHYEVQIPRESWFSGLEFMDPSGGTYPVVEVHKVKAEDVAAALSKNELTETHVLQGEEYDWLAGRQFPYAVWVEESVDALGEPKVYTRDRSKFVLSYKIFGKGAEKGAEFFSYNNLAIKYLNPPTS